MDINVNLPQWFITFFHKSLLVLIFQVVLLHVENKSAIKSEFMLNQHPSNLACLAKGFNRLQKFSQKNYTNQLLENLKNEKYTHLLKTIFVVLILRICNNKYI